MPQSYRRGRVGRCAYRMPHEDPTMHDMTPARASRRIARAADTWPPLAATVIALGRGVWLFPLDVLFRTVGLRYGWLRALFSAVPAPILAGLGRLRAERAAWRATRQVPAYRRFLGAAGVRLDPLVPLGILTRLPETNKATTSLTERWADRRVPMTRPSRDGPSQCRAARLDRHSLAAGHPGAVAAAGRDGRLRNSSAETANTGRGTTTASRFPRSPMSHRCGPAARCRLSRSRR